jgi:hypothetical protein
MYCFAADRKTCPRHIFLGDDLAYLARFLLSLLYSPPSFRQGILRGRIPIHRIKSLVFVALAPLFMDCPTDPPEELFPKFGGNDISLTSSVTAPEGSGVERWSAWTGSSGS